MTETTDITLSDTNWVYRNVIWKQQNEDSLFIVWYNSESGGDFSENMVCNLSFWIKGIRGTINKYQMHDLSWNIVTKRGTYIPKSEWIGCAYNGPRYQQNHNWAITSSRGKSARSNWKLCNTIPTIISETKGKKLERIIRTIFNFYIWKCRIIYQFF